MERSTSVIRAATTSTGRIWRISFEGRPVPPRPDLAAAIRTRESLDLLATNKEVAAREFARQELRHRGASKVQGDLKVWSDAAANDRARIEAVWTAQAFNQVPADAVRVLLTSSCRSRWPGLRPSG